MPFKKKNSPYYKIELKLDGFGDTGTLSTRTKRLKRALGMEELLKRLDEDGHHDLLAALRPPKRGKSGSITLPGLLHANQQNKLGELKKGLTDPLLDEAIRRFSKVITYDNHLTGLKHLMRLRPEGARLSYLKEAKNINEMVAAMVAEDYKENTVKNQLWGAISKMLQHFYDKGTAKLVLGNASRPDADDRRFIYLSAEECHRQVSALDFEMRMFVIISAGLGIDKSPVLRIRKRDFDPRTWKVSVRDTKNKARNRMIETSAAVAYVIQLLSEGKEPNALLLNITAGQVTGRWNKARTAAGFTLKQGFNTDLRLKDMRHTFAKHYLTSGGNIAGLMDRMGHVDGSQSLDYARHEVRGVGDMDRANHSMGFKLPTHLEATLIRPEDQAPVELEMPDWWFNPHAGPEAPKPYKKRTAKSTYDHRSYNREYMKQRRAKEREERLKQAS